jgi:hypothetical protein
VRRFDIHVAGRARAPDHEIDHCCHKPRLERSIGPGQSLVELEKPSAKPRTLMRAWSHFLRGTPPREEHRP